MSQHFGVETKIDPCQAKELQIFNCQWYHNRQETSEYH